VARRATVISGTRSRNANTLALDAGNSLAYDADPARATQGKTSVEAMNLMGYDAAALGQLDLALGPDVLRQRIAEAEFPFLSANVYDAASGERFTRAYLVAEAGGRKVAIVGLTAAGEASGFDVRDPVASLRALMPELRAAADIIILLSNAGEETDGQMVQRHPEVDLIVAGGSGRVSSTETTASSFTPRLQADIPSPGHAGRHVGVATLQFDPAGKLLHREWKGVTLTPDIADDPALAAWAATAGAAQP
jgi:2',3'-cyclic-nucleotide 2'-phosphodiesterase (5'-nucleotidase family)